MPESIRRSKQVDDQPALAEARSFHRDAQPFAHPAARSVASDQEIAARGLQRAVRTEHLEGDTVGVLLELFEAMRKARLDMRIVPKPLPELGFQDGLAKGVAPREAILLHGRLDAGEGPARWRKVVRAVALHDVPEHDIDETDALDLVRASEFGGP